MNALNFFTKTYSLLHNYPGVPYWVLTPLRKAVRFGANKVLPKYLAKPHAYKGSVEKGYILSFTSFPARINTVWQVVESLKNQSVLPEKIILWLSTSQFPTKEHIPDNLWKEEDDLFEIRMVEGDIRSHKKFYYVMQQYPEHAFITCDDDIYYHPDTLKNLIEASRRYPKSVIANVTRRIEYDDKGDLKPYRQWKKEESAYETENLIQIGAGGVLYPPKTLHALTLRKDLFFSLTPMADDIWLNCMARLNGTRVVQSAMKQMSLLINDKSPSLSKENISGGKNDEQISNLRKYLIENKLGDVYSAGYQIAAPATSASCND